MLYLQRVAKLLADSIEALRHGDSITARSRALFAQEELGRYLELDEDLQPFPIQGGTTRSRPIRHFRQSWVPWWLAEIAYEHYAARYGRSQSLERLAERGGFCRDELVGLIRREL